MFFRRYKRGANLALMIALEMGKPRHAAELAKRAGFSFQFLKTSAVVNTIKQRPDLSARVDDLVDALEFLPMADGEADALVHELSRYFDGSVIPRVARFARGWELRTELLERMFQKPPKDLRDIYDALVRPGLATDRARKFGEQLMRLAIERDEPDMLQRVARTVAAREVTLDEWKTLIRGRIGNEKTVAVEDIISVAMQAV